jgi:hypothetical protein
MTFDDVATVLHAKQQLCDTVVRVEKERQAR